MGKIIAIGGGEIANKETLAIDKEIIRLSGKKSPHVLFFPTASLDEQEYIDTFCDYYGAFLGCNVDVLRLIKCKELTDKISEKILSADIIYVGGGNTLMMMKLWRKLGIDKILKRAYDKGIVLCGISAGAICWFTYGNSDSRQFKNPDAPLIKVRGLDFIDALLCPHYHSEKYDKGRKSSLKVMMQKTPGVALAIDDFCALALIDCQYKLLGSKQNAYAYKVYWKQKKFFHEKIEQNSQWKQINELFKV